MKFLVSELKPKGLSSFMYSIPLGNLGYPRPRLREVSTRNPDITLQGCFDGVAVPDMRLELVEGGCN